MIKNSIESIQEKRVKNIDYKGNIHITLIDNISDIKFVIADDGLGFGMVDTNINDVLNPYFTTKKQGTGLGLSIVNKIVNDHNGTIKFISIKNGAKIQITFIKS